MLLIRISCLLCLGMLNACGGGGDEYGGFNGTSAVSHHVPYLLGVPTFSYAPNATDASKYDVTVTLQADGPTGVAFVNLWIYDENNDSNFVNLDLTNVMGTNTWTATTYSLLPLAPGDYYIESITMDDSDPFSGVTRTGWYFTNPLGGSTYTVDEREVDSSSVDFIFYNTGVTNISIARVTLP